jgi:succinate-acetate transporter protein
MILVCVAIDLCVLMKNLTLSLHLHSQLMFLNAMYGGLGQSLGAIIGGKMQSKFGTVKTFVFSGIFDLFFVSFVVIYLRLRKDSSFRNPKPIGEETTNRRTK